MYFCMFFLDGYIYFLGEVFVRFRYYVWVLLLGVGKVIIFGIGFFEDILWIYSGFYLVINNIIIIVNKM